MPTVNIDIRGYGKIYQAVMRCRSLPLISKAIYAYLCSYAGNGMIAFPKRDKIIRDLQINKDTFTKHLTILVEEGYIAKERTTTGNLYTILQSVPAYVNRPRPNDSELTDMLVMDNVKALGFGTVPKLLMFDRRLTSQSKAIYAYFASFAGAGTTAFPRRSTITRELKLSMNTYYKHFNLLLETGYISVEKRKNGGKYDVSIYHLADSIYIPSTLPHKPMSEKVIHGENGDTKGDLHDSGVEATPLSEKLIHGEEVLKTSKTDTVMSEKLIPEELRPDKMVHENFGQANINNNHKTNSICKKEQKEYHQPSTPVDDIDTPYRSYTIKWIKEQINYPFLQREIKAWCELKDTLGHFPSRSEKEHCYNAMNAILEEIPRQIMKRIKNPKVAPHILTALKGELFQQLFDDVMEHWNEIRNAKGYVGASIDNLIKSQKK